jgi:uncharacterized protein (DUF2147 family)
MKHPFRHLALSFCTLCFGVSTAYAADPIIGIWKTQPDRKDLTSHIKVTACGADFCGLVLEAFDPSGKKVETPNIGKKLFWDVKSDGDGAYSGGSFWVPLVDETVTPQFKINGDSMLVKGCKLDVCDSQTWTRL